MEGCNPYAHGTLQYSAFNQGWYDGRCRARRQSVGVSARVRFAYERGYLRTPWHRSPSGQVKWERR